MGKRGKNRKSKNPSHNNEPVPKKLAKHTQNPEGYQRQLIAWHFHCLDNAGRWPCHHETLKTISKRLHEYEKKRWNEVMEPKSNHPMPTDKIDPSAQRRLVEIGFGDTGMLYQLKIPGGQGKQRLWGIRQENVFQILWWDPKHTVYCLNK